MIRLLLLVATGSILVQNGTANDFNSLEAATKAAFETTLIDVTLCVKNDASGEAVSWPSLTVTYWNDGTPIEADAIESEAVGCFDILNMPRGTATVKIEATKYYTSVTPVDLRIPVDTPSVNLGDIFITRKRDGVARLVFGGDVMFDRRFFDKGILNLGDSLEQETRELFRHIKPFLEAGDHSNVNLECPIVEDYSTPHPKKNIVFGCRRETAEALPHVGIDSVTIANNHLYDYLEIGTQDTMTILNDVGMTWFGGGMTRQEARDSLHRFNVSSTGVNSVPLSFQGFTNYFDYAQGDAYTTVSRCIV